MSRKALFCCVFGAAAVGFALSSSASAHVLYVGECHRAHTTYNTVQSAVDAAVNGDTVSICPGTYAEQITVSKSVSLKGVLGMDAPVIASPVGGLVANTTMSDSTPTAAQILIGPQVTPGAPIVTANVTGLIVDGANNLNVHCSSLEMVGIYYKGAVGIVRQNTVRNQITPGQESCQNGIGVLVENPVAAGPVTIQNNNVSNFDKNGILMRLPGSFGTIRANTVTGIGPTTLLAQNGILLRDSASANIIGNNVSGFVYTPDTFGSAGIILYNLRSSLYQAPPVIQKNRVDNTQFGIVLDGANGDRGNPILISSNIVSNSLWDGIELESDDAFGVNSDYINVTSNRVSNTTEYEGIDSCANHNTIARNTVTHSTNWGIHLDSLCNQKNGQPSGYSNKVDGNTVKFACVGILSGPSAGANTIGTNAFSYVTNDIVYDSDDYTCSTAQRGQPHHNKFGSKSHPRLAVSP